MKRVVSSSIISVVILLLVAGGFFYYQYFRVNTSSALETVPADVAWMVSCDPSSGELRQLAKTGFFHDHDSVPVIRDWCHVLLAFDSLVVNTPALKEHFAKHRLYISGHVTGPQTFSLVFISDMGNTASDAQATRMLEHVFGKELSWSNHNYNGVDIHDLENANADKAFSWAVTHGVFVGSKTTYLVEDAIRQQRNSKVPSPATRLKVFLEGSEKSMLLAVRYATFQRWVNTQLNPAAGVKLAPLQRIGDWSAARVTIHPSQLTFAGTTTFNDSLEFISLFQHQQAVATKLTELLPARTAAAVAWGFSDAAVFMRDLSGYLSRVDQSSASSTGDRASLLPYFTPWLGHELGLIVTQPVGSGTDNHFFGVIGIADVNKCKRHLAACAASLGGKASNEEEVYNGYSIRMLPLQGILPSLFGPLFTRVNRFYYTIVNEQLVVANQASALRGLINDIRTGNLLVKDPRYPALTATMPAATNLLFIGSVPQSTALFASVAAPHWVNWLTQFGSTLKNWNGMSFAIANRQGVFSTTAALSYQQSNETGVSLLWNAKLDDQIAAGPFLIDSAARKIIVQDVQNQVYAIDQDGSIKWKRKVDSKIKGAAWAVDVYGNGDHQVMFNTTSFIYVLDTAGANCGNYPLRLPAAASSGITVLYGRNSVEDTRVFVACSNLRLYGYQLSGKPITGFSAMSLPGVVRDEVMDATDSMSNWMLIRVEDGTAFYFDRTGNRKLTLKEKVLPMAGTPINNQLQVDGTISWISENGSVLHADKSGVVQEDFKPEGDSLTGFARTDINGDQEADWVLTTTQGLQVKTTDGLVLFNLKHEQGAAMPEVVSWSGKKMLLYSIPGASTFVLINSDGTVCEGFPQSGVGPVINYRMADGSIGLVVKADDRSINFYQVR